MDVIDMCFQVGRATGHSEVEINKNAIVDVSQDGERQAWSFDGVIRSITTSSETFIFRESRTMQPVEHLLALGFANPVVTGLNGNKIRDLAGEAMPLPPVAIWGLGFWELQKAKEAGVMFIETSAKVGHNVKIFFRFSCFGEAGEDAPAAVRTLSLNIDAIKYAMPGEEGSFKCPLLAEAADTSCRGESTCLLESSARAQ
eukprot:6490832-Amphidinium_carterae.3